MMATRYLRGRFAGLALAIAALALGGCQSSPATRFYTLGAGEDAMTTTPDNYTLAINVARVELPEALDRKQMVLQQDAVRVQVLEQERWSTRPSDEIRRRLAANVAASLHAIDVTDAGSRHGLPVYDVTVNVRRFEAWFGSRVLIDAVWQVHRRNEAGLTCHSIKSVPIGEGYEAIVQGHQQSVDALGSDIATAIRALEAHSAPTFDCLASAPPRNAS